MPGQFKPPELPPVRPGMPEPSMIGLDPSIFGGGPPPMPFDPTVLEKQRLAGFDGGSKVTPADTFIQKQSDVLMKYYEVMVDHLQKTGQPLPGQEMAQSSDQAGSMYEQGE